MKDSIKRLKKVFPHYALNLSIAGGGVQKDGLFYVNAQLQVFQLPTEAGKAPVVTGNVNVTGTGTTAEEAQSKSVDIAVTALGL